MKKTFFISVLTVITILLNGCCGGEGLPDFYFTIRNLSIRDVLDGEGGWPLDTEYYSKQKLFKVITIDDYSRIAESKFSTGNSCTSFISNAYACSPEEPREMSINHVTDIRFTNTDTASYPVEDLTDLFEFITNYREEYTSIRSFLNEDGVFWELKEKYYFRFTGSLSGETQLTFDLTVTLSNGDKFVFSDEVMRLKP